MQAAGVVPVHRAQGGQFEVLDGLPWAAAGGPVDQFGLVEAVDRLGQGVVEAVPDRPDGRRRADLGEPLAVPHRGKLQPGVGVTSQAGQRDSA